MRTKLLFLAFLLTAVVAVAQFIPTQVIGDTTSVASRVVSTRPCKLWSVTGYNGHSSTQYLFIFDTGTTPTNGQAGKLGPFPVGASQFYSVDLSAYGATLDAVTIGVSTVANLFTNSATNSTIQAIITRLQ